MPHPQDAPSTRLMERVIAFLEERKRPLHRRDVFGAGLGAGHDCHLTPRHGCPRGQCGITEAVGFARRVSERGPRAPDIARERKLVGELDQDGTALPVASGSGPLQRLESQFVEPYGLLVGEQAGGVLCRTPGIVDRFARFPDRNCVEVMVRDLRQVWLYAGGVSALERVGDRLVQACPTSTRKGAAERGAHELMRETQVPAAARHICDQPGGYRLLEVLDDLCIRWPTGLG